jgi:hypothetical protein
LGFYYCRHIGFVATINCGRDHVVIIIGRLLYSHPSHASNSFLLFRSGKGKKKEFYFYIEKKEAFREKARR